MSISDDDDPWAKSTPAPPLSPTQRRRRLVATVLGLGALVTGLVITTAGEGVPSGATSMSGMDMGQGINGQDITLQDIDGRSLTLPGGKAGAVMFMATRGCGGCIETARALDAAARALDPPLPVTVISVDTEETKGDFERFDQEAGGLDVRYALDDASGSIANHFGVRELNTVLAYSDQGRTTGIFEPGPDQVAAIRTSLG